MRLWNFPMSCCKKITTFFSGEALSRVQFGFMLFAASRRACSCQSNGIPLRCARLDKQADAQRSSSHREAYD